MVDMTTQNLMLFGRSEPIVEWKVMFQTPFGLHEKVEEAITRVREADLDPDSTIVPVPVAVSGNSYEVVCR